MIAWLSLFLPLAHAAGTLEAQLSRKAILHGIESFSLRCGNGTDLCFVEHRLNKSLLGSGKMTRASADALLKRCLKLAPEIKASEGRPEFKWRFVREGKAREGAITNKTPEKDYEALANPGLVLEQGLLGALR